MTSDSTPARYRPAPAPAHRRAAGAKWRVLVHTNDKSHHIAHHRDFGYSTGYDAIHDRLNTHDVSEAHEFPGAEFDELVVGRWIHLEQMDNSRWWMSIGGVVVWVQADRDGRPKSVSVHGPGDYENPIPGCTYECTWTAGDGGSS